jgi:hypothetical protein
MRLARLGCSRLHRNLAVLFGGSLRRRHRLLQVLQRKRQLIRVEPFGPAAEPMTLNEVVLRRWSSRRRVRNRRGRCGLARR